MADTEKITMNMSVVDLGQIDLLVKEGFYSSRTDFIRTAIRNLLNTHASVVKESVNRQAFVMGVLLYNRSDLEERRFKGIRLTIKIIGMFILDPEVTPELALATIDSIEVHGVFRASEAVKKALGNRIK
jgi:Arc/MetJ-type ribon-helix-helix transcriptional regulator